MASPSRKKTTVYLDAEDATRLAAEADRQHRLQADLLREALRRYLDGLSGTTMPTPGLFAIDDYGLDDRDHAEVFGATRARPRRRRARRK